MEAENLEKEPLKGRAAFLSSYKEGNPDAGDDVDDESLWGHAHDNYSKTKGDYDLLNGANQKLSELVKENPELAVFLSVIAEGKSPMYAWGKSFGKMPHEFDDESLEEYEKGRVEHGENMKKSEDERNTAGENFKQFTPRLKKISDKYRLTPDESDELKEAVIQILEDGVMGNVSEQTIENTLKGLRHDDDIKEAMDVATNEAKNSAIDELKAGKMKRESMPDITKKSISATKQKPFIPNVEDGTSFSDRLQVSNK